MMNASRRISICGAIVSISLASIALLSPAAAQSATPVTALGRQLERVDFGITGIGVLTPSTSGTSLTPQAIAQVPSNTFGALIELRYIKSPLIGIELNYSYARYTENYTVTATTGTPHGQLPYVLGVQSKVNEYSLGYVAHGPRLFGLQPFGGIGLGAIEFKPTSGGGQGLPPQERTGVYYTVGLEQTLFSENFGIRAQFRQVFFGAPDFNENYLATGARTITTEPGVGFYLRF